MLKRKVKDITRKKQEKTKIHIKSDDWNKETQLSS